MGGGKRPAGPAQRRGDLEQAAGIGADVEIGARGEHVSRLAVTERPRRVGLDEVVDPGAAAAQLLLGGLDELEARDRAQQRAGLLAHALGVTEVAGLLEGDAPLERVQRRGLAPRERLRDVEDRQVELGLLQVGPASGGVSDDRLDAERRERGRAPQQAP
jgi:hypothetical protein